MVKKKSVYSPSMVSERMIEKLLEVFFVTNEFYNPLYLGGRIKCGSNYTNFRCLEVKKCQKGALWKVSLVL